jgi:hypothetical protein
MGDELFHTCGRTDGRTDITQIIFALRYFAKSDYETLYSEILQNSIFITTYFSSRLIFNGSLIKLIINF